MKYWHPTGNYWENPYNPAYGNFCQCGGVWDNDHLSDAKHCNDGDGQNGTVCPLTHTSASVKLEIRSAIGEQRSVPVPITVQ